MIPFEIIIDSREKLPFFLDRVGDPDFPDLLYKWEHLKTGDYSLSTMSTPEAEHSVCVERKSLVDLFGSIGRGRVRFEKEFERMSEFEYAALVVEADLRTLFKQPPPLSQMPPKAVFRTILSWSQRYNVHPWFCPDREFAQKTTFLLLKRFYDDRINNGKMEFCKI